MRCIRVMVAILLGSVPLLTPSAYAQCQELGLFEVYDRVLAYGRDLGPNEVTAVVAQYIPGDTSVDREVAFRIVEMADGENVVDIREGHGFSIAQQFRALQESRNEGECDEALIRRIRLDVRRSRDSKAIQGLLERLWRSRLPTRPEAAIYLDAPRYEISVAAPMNHWAAAVYGPSKGRAMHPLIEWTVEALRVLRKLPDEPREALQKK